VIARSTAAGLNVNVVGSTSANTGAPATRVIRNHPERQRRHDDLEPGGRSIARRMKYSAIPHSVEHADVP
jgi:hypothetical protein